MMLRRIAVVLALFLVLSASGKAWADWGASFTSGPTGYPLNPNNGYAVGSGGYTLGTGGNLSFISFKLYDANGDFFGGVNAVLDKNNQTFGVMTNPEPYGLYYYVLSLQWTDANGGGHVVICEVGQIVIP